MENITISITGKKSAEQASAIIRAFYKTMARMEDGGCHVQLTTEHVDEGYWNTGEVTVPDFMSRADSRRRAVGRR